MVACNLDYSYQFTFFPRRWVEYMRNGMRHTYLCLRYVSYDHGVYGMWALQNQQPAVEFVLALRASAQT